MCWGGPCAPRMQRQGVAVWGRLPQRTHFSRTPVEICDFRRSAIASERPAIALARSEPGDGGPYSGNAGVGGGFCRRPAKALTMAIRRRRGICGLDASPFAPRIQTAGPSLTSVNRRKLPGRKALCSSCPKTERLSARQPFGRPFLQRNWPSDCHGRARW